MKITSHNCSHSSGALQDACRWTAAAVLLCAMLLSNTASADSGGLRMSVEWGKFARVLREGGDSLMRERGFRLGQDAQAPTPRANEDLRWFGSSPSVALVARDWGGSQGLVGHLTLTDQLRVTRSVRMVVTRVRLGNGRISPFAQVGLGQWRIDTDLMPALRRDVELAGQLGGGLEIALSPRAAVAIEGDCTMLYREQHEPQMAFEPRIWGALLAARVQF